MRPSKRPICDLCEYYRPGLHPDNPRGVPVCRAFPEGIPDEILDGGFDHRKALDGETITFKLAQDATEEDLEEWEQEVLAQEKHRLKSVIEAFQEGEPAD